MNALHMAQKAYNSPSSPIRTSQSIEYETFRRITHQLKSLDRKSEYSAFVKTLHNNRQLWNLLAIDVANENNALPDMLRAQIFYLSEFTSIQTSKILKDDASVSALIDINVAIMAGLQQQGKSS